MEKNCVYVLLMPTLIAVRHLGHTIQQIEAELWPIFNFCTTLALQDDV